jgi:hypothetical protein
MDLVTVVQCLVQIVKMICDHLLTHEDIFFVKVK